MGAHERLTEPRVTMKLFLAKPRSFSNLPVFFYLNDREMSTYFSPHIYKVNPGSMFTLNPHTPVWQKIANEVVFRRFPGEGVEFFLIGWSQMVL